MSRRGGTLTAALGCFILILTASGVVQAHAAHVGFRVPAPHKVEIKAWFSDEEPMKGADVVVARVGGDEVEKGKTDERGLFKFNMPDAGSVEVTVSDRKGHGGKFTISPESVAAAGDRLVMLSAPVEYDPETPTVERGESFPLREVILGVTFLLAVAAFVISVRNAQAIKRIQESQKAPPA